MQQYVHDSKYYALKIGKLNLFQCIELMSPGKHQLKSCIYSRLTCVCMSSGITGGSRLLWEDISITIMKNKSHNPIYYLAPNTSFAFSQLA